MLWVLLLLSSISCLCAMDYGRPAKKKKLHYRLPNAFVPTDPDRDEFRACSFHVTPAEFDQITAMSDSFAQHVKDESTYLEADVQNIFNRMQQKNHHKKPTKSYAEITQELKKEHAHCKNELAALMGQLKAIEGKTDDSKYVELDLLEKKIATISRKFMILSHASNLHLLHTTQKRIEKISRERMNRRLSSLFALIEATQKEMQDAEHP